MIQHDSRYVIVLVLSLLAGLAGCQAGGERAL